MSVDKYADAFTVGRRGCDDPGCTPVPHERIDHLEPEGTALGRYWREQDRKRWLEIARTVLRPGEYAVLEEALR